MIVHFSSRVSRAVQAISDLLQTQELHKRTQNDLFNTVHYFPGQSLKTHSHRIVWVLKMHCQRGGISKQSSVIKYFIITHT